MKTYITKPLEIERQWYIVDASDETLGRLSSKVAAILRGKHKAIFSPSVDCGDFVIIINAEKIQVTGNKMNAKEYHRHSGYPGGLTTTGLSTMLRTFPHRVLEFAIKGMLPKNALGRQMYSKLKVYAGNEHPHQAQQPIPLEF